MSSVTLRLTEKDVPDGSVIAIFNDLHIPHHDERAMQLAIECCESIGVTHVLANGDILDCGPASRHEGKRKRAALDEGCLKESVAAGLWILDWFRTRPCVFTLGNHEDWVTQYIAASPELKGMSTESLLGVWEDGDGWRVLPNKSRVRIGNLNAEHGDGMFKGGGGMNPGSRMKQLAPDQTTMVGHLHRQFAHYWSSPDAYGIMRTRAAYGIGHMSMPSAHEEYAGTYTNWQQGFAIVRVYHIDGKARFTPTLIEIHRDKRNRPIFELEGKVYH